MLSIRIQKKAEDDLKAIWHYTSRNWGEVQAQSYLFDLRDFFTTIADNSKIGTDISHIRKGYRKMTFKKHLIIYRVTKKHISIVRILGIAMDCKRR
tara:strand:+ start:2270 stop:2557 length:288 start_codon:yes stop_codon:yes gene_type:complete